jgi:hypothetical protein
MIQVARTCPAYRLAIMAALAQMVPSRRQCRDADLGERSQKRPNAEGAAESGRTAP